MSTVSYNGSDILSTLSLQSKDEKDRLHVWCDIFDNLPAIAIDF